MPDHDSNSPAPALRRWLPKRFGHRLPRWIGLLAALVLLTLAGRPAHAAYVFGAEDRITKIVDLTGRGPAGEALYLGYKLKVYAFLLPIYMTDDGYVIGFYDDNTRYIPLPPDRIAALQRQGQLPTPLPPYTIGWFDWVGGYFLWVFLAGVAAIVGAGLVVRAALRRWLRQPGSDVPLTVAGMAAKRNRFVLALELLALLPVLAIAWWAHGFWLSVILGPRAANGAEIAAARSLGDGQAWFLLTERPQDLGVSRTSTYRTPQGAVQQNKSYLHVLPGSPNILLEAPRSTLEPPIYAWISYADPSEARYARAREAAEGRGYSDLAPYMLDWSGMPPLATRIGAAISAAPVLAALLLLLRRLQITLRALRDPLRSPKVRQLLTSCRASEGLDHLVAEIESEAARARLRSTSYGTFLLPSWLIMNSNLMSFLLMCTQDVVWITAIRVKTSQSPQIDVVDRFGRHLFFPAKDLNTAIQQILARAPWAMVGAEPELARAFGNGRSKPLGRLTQRRLRAEWIAHVDERRLAILAQTRLGKVQ